MLYRQGGHRGRWLWQDGDICCSRKIRKIREGCAELCHTQILLTYMGSHSLLHGLRVFIFWFLPPNILFVYQVMDVCYSPPLNYVFVHNVMSVFTPLPPVIFIFEVIFILQLSLNSGSSLLSHLPLPEESYHMCRHHMKDRDATKWYLLQYKP